MQLVDLLSDPGGGCLDMPLLATITSASIDKLSAELDSIGVHYMEIYQISLSWN